MKRSLMCGTALATAGVAMAGTAGAAEAPSWKLTGNMNFQFYYVDQDLVAFATKTGTKLGLDATKVVATTFFVTKAQNQDHDWYFGVDESELQLNVSGTADNGLNYGFKIEINANTTDGKVADEARLQFSGGWGTLQVGDEDGAEDIMNYGGENLMGATGGFDGDFDDVLIRRRFDLAGVDISGIAPSYPTIEGDTSDSTKVSYFSPRFGGFQVGASITPQPSLNGDDFKTDTGIFEDHYGIGANYDNSFGGLRVRASAVYSAASSRFAEFEDISAWSVGGIVGFGPFSVGGNYTDNGDSANCNACWGPGVESSYWNVAGSFESGPIYLSAGYFSSEKTISDVGAPGDSTFKNISLTADYSMAPGLGIYAEVDLIEDEYFEVFTNDATLFIAGANVSF